MLSFINQISLIRYLVVWKVNGALIRLPDCLSVEISRVLGTIIAHRLPTQEARAWRKAMTSTGQSTQDPLMLQAPPSSSPWPLKAVLFPYPGKRIYGCGESVMWELKLLGNHADHSLFLEVLLPAMEEAATQTNPSPRSLWGRFDIHAVYAARGSKWEPVVAEGKLNLNYRPTPIQWADGLSFLPEPRRALRRIHWLVPFELEGSGKPTLYDVLNALVARLTLFVPGKRPAPDDVWAWLPAEERNTLKTLLEEAKTIIPTNSALKRALKGWPGLWMGTQTYASIPRQAVPYLELASILHIGKHTHFGCGTFKMA